MKPKPPEPSLRDQLVAAEAAIDEQIGRLKYPVAGGGTGGPPDNRSIIAALQFELAELREAIANEDRQDGSI